MKIRKNWFLVPVVCGCAALAVVLWFSSGQKAEIQALRTNMMAASQRYPKYTMAQRMGILREWQSEKHPMFRDLSTSEAMRRLIAQAVSASASPVAPNANFFGNVTAINIDPSDLLAMKRTSTCSLTLVPLSYSLSLPNFTYSILGETPNYDQVLHSEAQLTTTGGTWPAGCGDPVYGVPSRKVAYLGLTSGGYRVFADVFYNGATGNNEVETVVSNASTDVAVSSDDMTDLPNPLSVVAADVNGDGNTDMVVLSDALTGSGSATISVLLGNADGTFGAPTNYTLPGQNPLSAVIDDFNGDGKPDIVVSSWSYATGSSPYYLSFLKGNGDGTFQAPQSVTLTPPANLQQPYFGLISTDLRDNGKRDLVSSSGVVLFGNGDGTFTQSSTQAFPGESGTSEFGPNVAAADFNKDGKMDLAVDNGPSISVFLGNGDGTFNAAGSYASIDNTGYLTATDLDGDGNPDLYSGVASAGMFGGDQFEFGQGYALMGNGDGTFQGAPSLPFVYTGTNLTDLNGDGIPDGVGVVASNNSSNVSMTSYLGKSNGSFTTGPTLTISPVTIGGTSFSFSTLDSFGLGDVNGDGKADLVYLPAGFYGPGGVAGYFLATGNGDGSFNAPVFIAAPTFAPSGDFDDYATLTGLWVKDINGDGKADLIYSYSVAIYQTNTYEQGIAVQLSNGDGTFAAPQVIQTYNSPTAPTGNPPVVVQIADATSSGKPDLFVLQSALVSNVYTTTLQLYLGNGDGTFGSALTPPVADNINAPSFGGAVGQIAVADMNGDGKPDLITLGTTDNGDNAELAISLGNGDGTFNTPTIVDFGGESSDGFGLAVADFNGDGKPDVAVTGFNPPFDTGIFLGNGDGTVQTFNNGNGSVEPSLGINLLVFGAASAMDWNGDGKPDLVTGSAVLLNLGAAAPTLTPTTTTMTTSATNIGVGQNVTFTATVSASSGTPSGTVTFYDGTTSLGTGTLGGSGTATFSTTSLTAGTHSISASYGGSTTFASSTSTPTTVTVSATALASTTTTLTASATTVNAGANVTFTATVAPSSGTGTPTGTVTFMDGTTTLGTGTLASGTTTYSTTNLAMGANSITAVYGGDSTFSGSTSSAVSVTVQAVTPSFTLGDSPGSGTVTAGQSAQTTITVTPANGFNSAVSFACSGLPTGATCTFNPTTVTPSGAAATTMLTIATTAQSGALAWPLHPGTGLKSRGTMALAVLFGGLLWVFGRRRPAETWTRLHLLGLLLVVAVAATIGCGGGSKSNNSSSSGGTGGTGSQSQSYTVTITATAGSETQTATYALTVQ